MRSIVFCNNKNALFPSQSPYSIYTFLFLFDYFAMSELRPLSNQGPKKPFGASQLYFHFVNNFNGNALGITPGNNMLNLLDLQTEVNTFMILKTHILRVIFTTSVLVIMQFFSYWQIFQDFCEILAIIYFILSRQTLQTKTLLGFRQLVNALIQLPSVGSSVFHKTSSHSIPTSMNDFTLHLPPNSHLPESMSLIVEKNRFSVPLPPDSPKPYLDADKKMVLPTQKEMENFEAARKKYSSRHTEFVAAERVRLLREISSFIFWTSLLPTASFANVYEPTGFLWAGSSTISVDELLEVISSLISNVFDAFFKHSNNTQPLSLPLITITEINSETSVNVTPFEFESKDEKTLGQCDYRPFTVYLSDLRVKKTLAKDLAAKDNEIVPPLSDLIIIPRGFSTAGYTAFNYDYDDDTKTSEVYSGTNSKFGFNLFFKSLYFFARNNGDAYSTVMDDSSTTVFSVYLQPGHYLLKFLQRLKNLRILDLRSSETSLHENL